jgi:hypothetical protein
LQRRVQFLSPISFAVPAHISCDTPDESFIALHFDITFLYFHSILAAQITFLACLPFDSLPSVILTCCFRVVSLEDHVDRF